MLSSPMTGAVNGVFESRRPAAGARIPWLAISDEYFWYFGRIFSVGGPRRDRESGGAGVALSSRAALLPADPRLGGAARPSRQHRRGVGRRMWLRQSGSNPFFSDGTQSSWKDVTVKVSCSNWFETPNCVACVFCGPKIS